MARVFSDLLVLNQGLLLVETATAIIAKGLHFLLAPARSTGRKNIVKRIRRKAVWRNVYFLLPIAPGKPQHVQGPGQDTKRVREMQKKRETPNQQKGNGGRKKSCHVSPPSLHI